MDYHKNNLLFRVVQHAAYYWCGHGDGDDLIMMKSIQSLSSVLEHPFKLRQMSIFCLDALGLDSVCTWQFEEGGEC